MSSGPRLSLCMIVKNEEHCLRACLESVQPLSPELILVDTGSTDSTPVIGHEFAATLIPFDFEPIDFSAARNAALARATAPWILVLDADETFDPASVPLLSSLIAQNQNTGYFLKRNNYSGRSFTPHVDHVVRLFPNRLTYRFSGRVHESVDYAILTAGGRLLPTDIQLHHRFIDNPEARRRKNFWYIQILKEEMLADPSDDSRLDFLAAEYHQLGMFEEATALIEELARRRPQDAQAHLFAGTYHLLFKPDWKQARIDFTHALQLRPGYSEAESFLRLLDEKERNLRVTA